MYEPQYQCWTCGIPMRYDGQCLKCKEPKSTTTEKAISALNARNHRGSSTWCRCNNDGDVHDGIPRHFLDPTTGFLWHNEAIAIAEWYERNPESK